MIKALQNNCINYSSETTNKIKTVTALLINQDESFFFFAKLTTTIRVNLEPGLVFFFGSYTHQYLKICSSLRVSDIYDNWDAYLCSEVYERERGPVYETWGD